MIPLLSLNSHILMKSIIFTYFACKGQELEAPEYDQQVLEDLGTGLDQQLQAWLLIRLSKACLFDLK
jgi:hypothetical protein